MVSIRPVRSPAGKRRCRALPFEHGPVRADGDVGRPAGDGPEVRPGRGPVLRPRAVQFVQFAAATDGVAGVVGGDLDVQQAGVAGVGRRPLAAVPVEHRTATAGDPHVVTAVAVDAVEVHVGVCQSGPVPRPAVLRAEDGLVAVHDVTGAVVEEVDGVDCGARPGCHVVPGPGGAVLEGEVHRPGVAGDVDVRLAGGPGHRHVVEVVRHVVGRAVVREHPGRHVVLANGAGATHEPERLAVVGHVRAVEVVPVSSWPAIDDFPPARLRPSEDDTAAGHGVCARVGVGHVVDRVGGGGLDGSPLLVGQRRPGERRHTECRCQRRADSPEDVASSGSVFGHCTWGIRRGVIKRGVQFEPFRTVENAEFGTLEL